MVKYLAKFLPKLSEVCKPLRSLTNKDAPWERGETHDKAFQDIQRATCDAPVLKYFDQKAATEDQGDASSKGLGFACMQEERPVSYASKALILAEQNYSQTERELLAQVFGVEHHHTYIYGRKITLWTDHKPLVSNISKPLTSAPERLQRLLLTHRLEHDRSVALEWFSDNFMKSNADKCHLLVLGQSSDDPVDVRIGNSEVVNSSGEKLLGIQIDNKLSFDNHVSKIVPTG